MLCEEGDQVLTVGTSHKDGRDRGRRRTTDVHGNDCIAAVRAFGDTLVINNCTYSSRGTGVIELDCKGTDAALNHCDLSGERPSRQTRAAAVVSVERVDVGINSWPQSA